MDVALVQLSTRVPEPLARRFKSCAAGDGKTIQEILTKAIDEYLASRESGQARELAEAMAAGQGAQS